MPDHSRAASLAPPATGRRDPFRIHERLPFVLHMAFWIQIAGAAYSSLNLGIMLLGFNRSSYLSHARAVAEQKHERILPDAFVVETFYGFMVVFAIIVCLEVGIAFLIRRGFNWARILYTIGSGLGLLSVVFTPPTHFVTWLIMVGNLVPVVLIWLPVSNRYFRAVLAARRLHRSRQL